MSVRAFAAALKERGVEGASYGMVRRYLAGETVPGAEFIEQAADLLGYNLLWLWTGKGRMIPTAREGAQTLSLTLLEWMHEDAEAEWGESVDVHGNLASAGPLQSLTSMVFEAAFFTEVRHHGDEGVATDRAREAMRRVPKLVMAPARGILHIEEVASELVGAAPQPSEDALRAYIGHASYALYMLAFPHLQAIIEAAEDQTVSLLAKSD